jgi:hypothetical protein
MTPAAGSAPQRLAVRRSDLSPLVEAVAAQAAAGRGWINLAPDVGDGEGGGGQQPARSGGWFSARGPAVPHATLVPGRTRRRGRVEPARVGIEHGRGPRAVAQLAASGHPVPTGWRVRQDHPRRGLVVEVAADAPAALVVDWLVGAAARLSEVPTGDAWLAEVWAG